MENANNTKNWDQLSSEFQHKSDRATAILGCVYLNVNLKQLIETFMVTSPEDTAALLGEEKPISSFSARIKTAYCLGLISPTEYHDLKVLSQIRNKFTSGVEIVSFAEDGIRELCFQLKIPREILLSSETRIPRHLFVFTLTLLVQHLSLRIDQAAQIQRTPPDEFMLIDVD